MKMTRQERYLAILTNPDFKNLLNQISVRFGLKRLDTYSSLTDMKRQNPNMLSYSTLRRIEDMENRLPATLSALFLYAKMVHCKIEFRLVDKT